MQIYSLENIASKFSEHAILVEEDAHKFIENFKEKYPEEPLPQHMCDDFNLPKALACICEEILRLKDHN